MKLKVVITCPRSAFHLLCIKTMTCELPESTAKNVNRPLVARLWYDLHRLQMMAGLWEEVETLCGVHGISVQFSYLKLGLMSLRVRILTWLTDMKPEFAVFKLYT